VTGDIIGGTQFSWGYTGGVTEQYGYDANRMQLTSQKAGTASPYTNRMDLTYSYSATPGQMGSGTTAGNTGQLVSISGTIGGVTESEAYSYDNLGCLVTSNQTSNGSSAQRRLAYDRWGNRTAMWDATSGGNQIQSITLQQSGGAPTNQIASVTAGSTVNYTYDAAGNVTNDGVHSYGYDSENRIVSVDGGSTASYSYDQQNRRYKKTIGSIVTHYVWQGSQVLAEHNGSTGAVLIDYVYSGSRMIAKVASGSVVAHFDRASRGISQLSQLARLIVLITGGVGATADGAHGAGHAEGDGINCVALLIISPHVHPQQHPVTSGPIGRVAVINITPANCKLHARPRPYRNSSCSNVKELKQNPSPQVD